MKRFVVLHLVLACLVLSPASFGQDVFVDVTELPEGAHFEFLLGDWTYEFPSGHGTASYVRAANGKAIREAIEGVIQNRVFAGSSLTIWDDEEGHYRRKWIDTLGNTLEGTAHIGDYEASELPALISNTEFDGVKIRHVWYNITAHRFETDLLFSDDGGTTYRLVRRMPYILSRE